MKYGAYIFMETFIIGAKAKELLNYTLQQTKIRSDNVSGQTLRTIFNKIAALQDITQVQQACSECIHIVDKKNKKGFSKSAYKTYGCEMREAAKQIVVNVEAARDCQGDNRIQAITQALGQCRLLSDYIEMCIAADLFGLNHAKPWIDKNEEVRRMLAAWLKTTQGQTIKAQACAAAENRNMIKQEVAKAIKQQQQKKKIEYEDPD